jgi:hypothetical protein
MLQAIPAILSVLLIFVMWIVLVWKLITWLEG